MVVFMIVVKPELAWAIADTIFIEQGLGWDETEQKGMVVFMVVVMVVVKHNMVSVG
jgi:hypothetical protein